MEDDIQYTRTYALCDYCGKRTRVVLQHLGGVLVNTYCKRCTPQGETDADDE